MKTELKVKDSCNQIVVNEDLKSLELFTFIPS